MIRKESIAVINDSLSHAPLSDAALAGVSHYIEQQLRSLLATADTYARHSYQPHLLPEHVQSALRSRSQPAVYGYRQQSLHRMAPTFVNAGDDVFYQPDELLDFSTVLNASLPPAPVDVGLTLHWLAVEGVQPNIPQNPQQSQPVTSTSAVESKDKEKLIPVPLPPSSQQTATAADEAQQPALAKLKLLSAHVLSKEQQMFFDRVTAAVIGNDARLAEAALQTLVRDSGLQQLLPYFVHFVSQTVAANLRSLPILSALLSLATALLTSPHLYVEPYLHQLLPSLLTLVLARRLCSDASEDHWTLRRNAATLLRLVCDKYGSTYTTLQPRITRTLLNALLDTSRSLPTHYGAVVAITALGIPAIRATLLPYLRPYGTLLARLVSGTGEAGGGSQMRRMEAGRVWGALCQAAGLWLQQEIVSDDVRRRVERDDDEQQAGREDRLQREAGSRGTAAAALEQGRGEDRKRKRRDAAHLIKQHLTARKRPRGSTGDEMEVTADENTTIKQQRQQQRQESSSSGSNSSGAADSGSGSEIGEREVGVGDMSVVELLDLFGDALLPYVDQALADLDKASLQPSGIAHYSDTFL